MVAPFDVSTVDPAGAMAIIAPGNLDDMRELAAAYRPKVLSSNIQTLLMDYFQENQNLRKTVEGRIVYQR